jgi:signal transduction histidine kinase
MIFMDQKSWKILLIEDDEGDYILTSTALTSSPIKKSVVKWVQTYQSALEELDKDTYDAVLVDHFLGEHTGLDLIREAVSRNYQPPFILLTGQDTYELDLEASRSGAMDFLAKKDMSPSILERTIRYAIARSQSEKEIAEHNIQIEVQHRLIQQREMERLNIARELHDGPLQELIGISYILQDALTTSSGSEEPFLCLQEKVKTSLANLNHQAADLRSYCSELRPPALTPFGLEPAIRSYAETFQQKHPGISFTLNLDHDGQRIPELKRMALFRIFQECLSNVVRHSKATEVEVRLEVSEDAVDLEVNDNGQGFIVPKNWIDLAREGHLGFVGIMERAEAIGGKIQVRSYPGEGTSLVATIPLTSG